MTEGDLVAKIDMIFAKHAAAAQEEIRSVLAASGAAPFSDAARGSENNNQESTEIDAFVAAMLAWVTRAPRVHWKAKRQLLIWYAYNIYCQHDRKIDLLPYFEKRLDTQGQRQLRQLLATDGKYEALGAEEGNRIRVNGRRLAEKFKQSLSGEEARRWDWLLAALVVGAWGAGATSTALAAGKESYGAAATFKVLAVVLIGIVGATAGSLALCQANPGSEMESKSDGGSGSALTVLVTDVSTATAQPDVAAPSECAERHAFFRRRCYVDMAASLEESDVVGAVARYQAALAIVYSETDVPADELKKFSRNYFDIDSRGIRLRLASLLSRHGRNLEAAAMMREQLLVRRRLSDAPRGFDSDEDCGIAIALMMRAGEIGEARAVAESCGGQPFRPYFAAYQRSLAYAAAGEAARAVRSFADALGGFLVFGEVSPGQWVHLGTPDSIALDIAQRLSQAIDEAEQRGDAVRLGEIAVLMAADQEPMPQIVIDLWRLLDRPCATRAHSRRELLRQRTWNIRLSSPVAYHNVGFLLSPKEQRSYLPATEFFFDVSAPDPECFDIKATVDACRIQGRLRTGPICTETR